MAGRPTSPGAVPALVGGAIGVGFVGLNILAYVVQLIFG